MTKQFIRLFASDVAKKALENYFGVKLAFYNCHKGVAATTVEDLKFLLENKFWLRTPALLIAKKKSPLFGL